MPCSSHAAAIACHCGQVTPSWPSIITQSSMFGGYPLRAMTATAGGRRSPTRTSSTANPCSRRTPATPAAKLRAASATTTRATG